MRRLPALLSVLALALFVTATAACTRVGDDRSTSGAGSASDGGARAPAAGGTGGGGGGRGADRSLRAVPVGATLTAGRSIISMADVHVVVRDVEVAAGRALDIVAGAGGFLAHQDARLDDRVVHLTLRVPSMRFQEALGDVSDIGRVIDADVSTQDVTEDIVDLETRVASARSSIERLQALLDRAGDVPQVVSVESELARREAELESLLGRLRVLEDQVDLSTIDVRFTEDQDPAGDLPGFLDALQGGWGAFVATARVVLAGVGYVVPFAAVLALAALAGRLIRRRVLPSASAAPDA